MKAEQRTQENGNVSRTGSSTSQGTPRENSKAAVQPNAAFPKGITAPATRALIGAGYTDLRQLAGVRSADLKQLHGMGPKALARLREALIQLGLSLA